MSHYPANEQGIRYQPPMMNPGSGTYGESPASGPAPTTAGHHRHDILNKFDPRVDSTQDRRPMPMPENNVPAGTYGPHRSRVANALDPRVDSDMDRRGPAMHGAIGGGGAREGTYGPHQSRMANALDPRVDSGRDNRTTGGYGYQPGYEHHAVNQMPGPGPAPSTAGPHRSDLLNKLDPRVDSRAGTAAHASAAPGYTERRRI